MFKTKKVLVIFMLLGGLQSTHSAQPAGRLGELAHKFFSFRSTVEALITGSAVVGATRARNARALQEEIERQQAELQEQIARLQAELTAAHQSASTAQPAPRAQAPRRLSVAQQPAANKLFDKEAFLQSMNLELIKTGVELNTLIEHLRREITKLDTRLQQDTQRYLAEIQRLEAELATTQQQAQSTQADLSTKVNELQRLYNAIHDLLKRTVTRYSKEISILRKQIKMLALQNQIADLQKDKKLQKLHDDLLAKLAAAEERAHTAEAQVAQMQDDINALQRDLPDVIDKSIEPFFQQLQTLQTKLKATEEILEREVEIRVATEFKLTQAKEAGMGLLRVMEQRALKAERQLAQLQALLSKDISV